MRIGRYSVPTIRLYPTLIDAARRLYNRFQNNEVSNLNEVATILNHTSAKSGAFLLKLTALRASDVYKRQVEEKIGEYIELSAGEIRLKLPLTEEGIEAVEAALTILKKRLKQAAEERS